MLFSTEIFDFKSSDHKTMVEKNKINQPLSKPKTTIFSKDSLLLEKNHLWAFPFVSKIEKGGRLKLWLRMQATHYNDYFEIRTIGI